MRPNKIELDEKKGELKVTFDVKIYNPSCILKTADVFSDACQITVKGDPQKKIQIILKPKSKEIALETLGYEFYNYALATIKQSSKLNQ